MTIVRGVSLWLMVCVCAAAGDFEGTSISASLVDIHERAIAGAAVRVIEEGTGREAVLTSSDDEGAWRVPPLPPGRYVVIVSKPGFQRLELRQSVVDTAPSDLGRLTLALGKVREDLSVAEALVNPEESDHTGMVGAGEIESLPNKGRDVISLLRLLPDVHYEDDGDALGDSGGRDVPAIGGLRPSWNSVTVDGVSGNDLGSTRLFASTITLEAVAEVRVRLNAYKAEHGRTGGAGIQVVSKRGGARLSGSAYWYLRRDGWNANRWSENRAGRPRPRQRIDTWGLTLGGPVPLPGTSERRLFFQYSLEAPAVERPEAFRRWRMPTAREREGDFSRTFDGGGRLVLIRDPLLGLPCTHGSSSRTSRSPADYRGCFPGNKIPADRIEASVQNLLHHLPLPNADDPDGNFNYTRTEQREESRRNHVLRLDWKPNARDSVFLRLLTFESRQKGDGISGGTTAAGRWGWFDGLHRFDDQSVALGYTRILSPALVHQLVAGGRRQARDYGWASEADRAALLRDTVGWRLGQFHPHLNPMGLLPVVRFGGGSSGVEKVELTYPDRQGASAADWLFSIRDDVSWARGRHTFKAGIYVDHQQNNEARGGNWAGIFDFASDSANPFDTGNGFANGLLGYFQSYEESTGHRAPRNRAWMSEAFAQDTWKAARRLTVDYGLRLLWYTPWWQADGRTAAFSLEHYDPARAPRIYRPVHAGGRSYAQDPAGGPLLDETLVGTFVPGSGDPANGMIRAGDPGVPRGFIENRGLHPEPRVGMAFDVFGNGRTAVHMSGGLFHQARLSAWSLAALQGPPFVVDGALYHGRTAGFLDGSPLANRPGEVRGIDRRAKTPSTCKWSAGVQQQLPAGIVADVSYVGNVGRHLAMQRLVNEVPDGARWLDVNPQNDDPRPGRGALPNELLRPLPGYQRIRLWEHFGTSRYNALQVQLHRRARGLQLGLAYSYSKTMGVGDDDPAYVAWNRPLREWHDAPASFDPPHSLVVHAAWDVPRASALWNAGLVRLLGDGWRLSGEYARIDGGWAGVNLDTTDNFDFTGGEGGQGQEVVGGLRVVRPVVVGKPERPGGDPVRGMFRAEAFRRPSGRGDYGNAPRHLVRNPGVENVNLSLFKTVGLGGRRRLTLRLEAFNALNHTQFSGVDRTARFDADGVMVNGNFGRATSARRPREVQASVRLAF